MRVSRLRDDIADTLIPRLLHVAKPVSRLNGILLGAVVVGLVAAADVVLGPSIQLTSMYSFGPIITAWCSLRRDGMLLALFTAVISTTLHMMGGTLADLPVPLMATSLLRFTAWAIMVALVSQLRSTTERFEELSTRDDLTGLLNRRALIAGLTTEIERARRYGSPLSLVYADVDEFKVVNDRFGHTAGDEYLIRMAEAMELALRPTDLVARMGGDEFVVVLPQTDQLGAQTLCRRLAEQLSPLDSEYDTDISIGLAAFDVPPDSVEAALTAADRAMYAEKAVHHTARDWAAPAAAPAPQT